MAKKVVLNVVLFFWIILGSFARDFKELPDPPTVGDKMLDRYFQEETQKLEDSTVERIAGFQSWPDEKAKLRKELQEMLGLMPLPERTPLKPKITGSFNHEGVTIEKLHFQSRPGLYVTANFYRPEKQSGPLPTILYVCGHGRKMDGKISLGNKTYYHHHPLWFAKNGYTCLIIDTLQLGEIEGIHHGTHRYNRWWWNCRGYTPAGVEAWNGMRALDYLETRPEVDKTRFGITGRSGGGAYTFWTAAMDERLKVVVPVAGITSMKNHVVDGCIEGHCDCMFMVNTYQWDFPLLATLIAPRPMLIVNTDKDRIFPTKGVVDVYSKARGGYTVAGKPNHLGLAFYEGPHKDTQPLRVAAFHWFERYLKGKSIDSEMASTTAPQSIAPKALRVFESIPTDELNTKIDESFVSIDAEKDINSEPEWIRHRQQSLERLQERSFRAWPGGADVDALDLKQEWQNKRDGMVFTKYSYVGQGAFRLPLYLVHREGLAPEALELVVLNVMDSGSWKDFLSTIGAAFPAVFEGIELPPLNLKKFQAEVNLHRSMKWGMAYTAPRGIGPTAWTDDAREAIHIRRRFALLGQTVDGMRVWDIRRGIAALRSVEGADKPQLWLQSNDSMAGNVLYASLFESGIHRLDLHRLPSSHRSGPEYLNVLQWMDVADAVAFSGKETSIRIYSEDQQAWAKCLQQAKAFGWGDKQIQIRNPVAQEK